MGHTWQLPFLEMGTKKNSEAGWVWLPANLTGGAGGGAYSKLFRNDSLTAPDLLAREVLQNSWDAALTRTDDDAPPFRFRFRFATLTGSQRSSFSEVLDLKSLVDRRQFIHDDRNMPPMETVEQLVGSKKPLRILYLEDYGTHGMWGDPMKTTASHLFKALYILGSTTKDTEGSTMGGSFGFGKSAFINCSGIRTAIAHSRFEARSGDPVTQRLVGFTWWSEHDLKGMEYEGRAMFGIRMDDARSGARPLTDSAAARVGEKLGMPERGPASHERGSTVLLLDPVVSPEEVIDSVERYWWPALEDHLMDVVVQTEDGGELVPRPRARKKLVPFIRAYGIASGLKVPISGSGERLSSSKWRADGEGTKFGSLALVVDKEHPGAESDEDEVGDGSRPLIALIRGPRMVIEYKSFNSRLPIRGTYVASDEIDAFLREVEPPAHNTWDNTRSQQLDPRAREIARGVLTRIRRSVQEFADEFSPPPTTVATDLPLFGDLLSGLLAGRSVGPNPPFDQVPEGRDGLLIFRVAAPDRRERSSSGKITLQRTLRIRVPASNSWQGAELRVSVKAFLAEDLSSSGSDPVKLKVVAPGQFQLSDSGDEFRGTPEPGEDVEFTLITDPCPEDVSLLISPSAELRPAGFLSQEGSQ